MIRFLLKLTFLLGLVIWFVPIDDQSAPKSSLEQTMSTLQTINAASAVWSDAESFCTRQPQACAIGAATMTKFSEKAAKGARMVSEYLEKNLAEKSTEKKLSAKGLGANNS